MLRKVGRRRKKRNPTKGKEGGGGRLGRQGAREGEGCAGGLLSLCLSLSLSLSLSRRRPPTAPHPCPPPTHPFPPPTPPLFTMPGPMRGFQNIIEAAPGFIGIAGAFVVGAYLYKGAWYLTERRVRKSGDEAKVAQQPRTRSNSHNSHPLSHIFHCFFVLSFFPCVATTHYA
jgi:hypothetical protein